jgi:hypothetical protein
VTQTVPIRPDRAALIERAAQWLADRPHTPAPVPALIEEFQLSVAEACAAARRVGQMRKCRAAFS